MVSWSFLWRTGKMTKLYFDIVIFAVTTAVSQTSAQQQLSLWKSARDADIFYRHISIKLFSYYSTTLTAPSKR